LRGFFRGASDAADDVETMQIRLHTVVLSDRLKALGKTIADLNLNEFEVDVTTIRRGKNRLEPTADLLLQAADVVVLRGTAEGVARAEQRLLK